MTLQKSFGFSVFCQYIYLPPWGLCEFQIFYCHIRFSSDGAKPRMLNYVVLFKACHQSLQDMWYGEDQCYSFTLHFISFDFIQAKAIKLWEGESKAFNNNHLRCYAIGTALLTRLPPLSPHRVIKASEISQLNPFQHIPSFHSYCSYVCSALTILSELLQSPPSGMFFFFHMISLPFYYWIILWCLDIQILCIHMLMIFDCV